MFPKALQTFSSFLTCLRSCLTVLVGSRRTDEWEPLYANDPRFGDENYKVVFATTRSVN